MARMVKSGQQVRFVTDENGQVTGYADDQDQIRPLPGAARTGRTAIIIGDSLGEQNGGPGGLAENRRLWANHGYVTWLRAFLRGGLNVRYNYAVGGQTSAVLFSRLQGGEIPLDNVDYVLWLLSGNDIAYESITDAAVYRTLIDQMLPLLTQQGACVLVGTIPPRAHTGSGTFDSAAKRDLVMQVNDHLLKTGSAHSGVVVFDTFGPLTEVDGTPRVGILRDAPAIHPSARGAFELAQLFESAGRTVLPRDGYQLGRIGIKGQMITTALSAWAANTPIGAFGTETISQGVSGSDGRADWTRIQLAAPSAAGACRQISHPAISPGATTYQEGDLVVGLIEVEVPACVDMRSIDFQLNVGGLGVTVDSMAEFTQAVTDGGFSVSSTAPLNRLVFATPEYEVPAGVTSITPRVRLMVNSASSSADVRVRNPTFLNLTKLRA